MKSFSLKLILLSTLLSGCKIQMNSTEDNFNKMNKNTTAEEINKKILERFSQADFKPIDGQKIFGPDIAGSHSNYYVTKLSREEVLGIFSEIIDPYVQDQNWGDDYGQLHGSFKLKNDPKMRFGIGISFLKMKPEDFKDYPDILKNYQTDIVYTQPYEWDEQ